MNLSADYWDAMWVASMGYYWADLMGNHLVATTVGPMVVPSAAWWDDSSVECWDDPKVALLGGLMVAMSARSMAAMTAASMDEHLERPMAETKDAPLESRSAALRVDYLDGPLDSMSAAPMADKTADWSAVMKATHLVVLMVGSSVVSRDGLSAWWLVDHLASP